MLGKKFLLTVLILIAVISGTSACSLLPPALPISPPPSAPSNQTNPDWAPPTENSNSAQPLPDLASVISEAMPSVVAVTTETVVQDIFHREYTQSAAGSGAIIDAEGHIITNCHVVNNADKVQVELADGRTFPADIVGTDSLADLAVLKIDATDLPCAQLGDSSQLVQGDWVVAIGNAMGQGISATHGIVSRLDVLISVSGTTLCGLIQTDAAINPGNSGGPLVNIAGEIIGITSVKLADVNVEGMGYAISINSAEPIIADLIHQGYVSRPWLGVSLCTIDPYVAAVNNFTVNEGAVIVEVVAGSPADAAGLEPNDIIVKLENREITTVNDLLLAIHDCQIGQNAEITFVRGEDTKTTWAQLQESPAPWD